MFKTYYQVIMLLHAFKGRNHIVMLSNTCRIILHCIMMSLTLYCLAMTLPISLCKSSVAS